MKNIGWRVIYNNSGYEYPKYQEIDRENLKDFILYDKDTDENLLWVSPKPQQRLVYRATVSMDFINPEVSARVYSIGLYDDRFDTPILHVFNVVQDGRKFESDFWPRFVQKGGTGHFTIVAGPEPVLRDEEKKKT